MVLDHPVDRSEPPGVIESSLPDVTGVDIAELRMASGTPLEETLSRLLRTVDDTGGTLAGFISSI